MKSRSILLVCCILFLSAVARSQSPIILFEASFDSTLQSKEGESPSLAGGVSYADGFSDKGVFIGSGDTLQYPILNNLNSREGSLSLWVRPNWDPGSILYRIFVLGNDPRNFELHVDESKQLAFSVNVSQADGKPIKVAFASAENWSAGNWYFLTFTWNSDTLKIFVNGNRAGEVPVGFDIPFTSGEGFHLGSFNGEQAFNGIMDELRIYDGPLSDEEVLQNFEGYLEDSNLGSAITVRDIFGREVTTSGMTLVDWEGPISNPAIKYYFQGNDSLEYPLGIELSTGVEKSYFNLPSTISKDGPAKSLTLFSEESIDSILFSFFMDEDFEDDTFDLVLEYPQNGIRVSQRIPVRVIDQDYDRPLSYPVTVDFSEAIDTFMLDPAVQEVITEAARDWLYYVDGEGIDTIEAGGSYIYIGGQDHNFEEKRATNPAPYKGYYLYAFENTNEVPPCFCSTGFPNRELLQTKDGEVVPIPRIGALHLNKWGQDFSDTKPNGWEVLSPYEDWTMQGFGFRKADLYSLAKHEIGHAMVFEEIPLYIEAQQRLGFVSPALTEYYHAPIVPLLPESTAHLFGLIDPASQRTPYGGGVENPVMEGGREMLTKLDVLIMESVGYPIRENEVTRALSLTSAKPLVGEILQPFSAQLLAKGGVPVYSYELAEGEMPPGLELDETSGNISGIPGEDGVYFIALTVRDYSEGGSPAILETSIRITGEGSDLAELLSFEIEGQVGESVIDNSAKTIRVTMPAGTDVTALSPTVMASAGADIHPGSGETLDFSHPVVYHITSENSALQNSWTVTVTVEVVSVEDHSQVKSFDLYPNPATSGIRIEFVLEKYMRSSLRIYDMNGRTVLNDKLGNINSWNQWHDLSGLPPGLYLLQILGEESIIASERLVIK